MNRSGPGIYIHIPFCVSKCHYCGFNSYPSGEGVPDWYVKALLADAETEALDWQECEFESVYLGGGTPSLLESSQAACLIDCLRQRYRLSPDAEITLECNPNKVTHEKLAGFRNAGVTRVSIGVQSLKENELLTLGRRHRPHDAARTLRITREVGFSSISADVMLGIPGQDSAGLAATLDAILDMVDHISVYILSVEPGTTFERLVDEGAIRIPCDDLIVSFYHQASITLENRGFRRYEISNWSRPGHECVHNQIYWQRGNYAGLGAGAHSHRDGRRYSRLREPLAYATCLEDGSDPIEMNEMLNEEQVLLEDMMLGLRTARGIDLKHVSSEYRIEVSAIIDAVTDLVTEGYLVTDGNHLLLSPKGIIVSDAVFHVLASIRCPAKA